MFSFHIWPHASGRATVAGGTDPTNVRLSVREELNRDCLVCTTCLFLQLWENSHAGAFPPQWRTDYDDVRARVCLCVHWEMVLTQTGPAPCTCQCNKSQQPQQCRRRDREESQERKIKSPGRADVNSVLSSSLRKTKCWCLCCGMLGMAALTGRVGRCVWSEWSYGSLGHWLWGKKVKEIQSWQRIVLARWGHLTRGLPPPHYSISSPVFVDLILIYSMLLFHKTPKELKGDCMFCTSMLKCLNQFKIVTLTLGEDG